MAPTWEVWIRRVTLPRLRAAARGGPYRRIWALTAVAYVVVSLFIGQMLFVYPQSSPLDQAGLQVTYIAPGEESNPYLTPAVLVIAPHVVLALAYWPTLVMVTLGVAIGLSVAATVSAFVAQRRRQAEMAVSGVAPAVTGWAFLGACCCTTCAAQVAATGLVGVTVGSTPSELLGQAWPLAVLQLGVVGLSLLFLEYRLERPPVRLSPVTSIRRLVSALSLRVLLLIAAVTWLFAFVLEWSEGGPVTPAVLYHWTVEHGVLAGFAVAVALAPVWARRLFTGRPRSSVALRVALLTGGVTWGLWVPPVLVSAGLGGFLNELFGYLGLPAAWGAEAPDTPLGAALLFHWGFQHLLLAGWAIAVALRPTAALTGVEVGEEIPSEGVAAPAPRPVPAVGEPRPGD